MAGVRGRTSTKSEGGARSATSLRLVIPSDYSACRGAENRVIEAAASRGYSDDALFAIRLALEEALANAIKHGNRLDPSKKVTIQASINPLRTRISIEDQGHGFSRRSVPDPTCEANVCKAHGRGILLIESYMDDVKWTHGGRRLTMVRKNA